MFAINYITFEILNKIRTISFIFCTLEHYFSEKIKFFLVFPETKPNEVNFFELIALKIPVK